MNRTPRVLIVNEVAKITPGGGMRSMMDFAPALKYGEIEVIVPAGTAMISTEPIVKMVEEALIDFTEEDYLIPTGDPAIIMIVGAMAAQKTGGKLNILRWDKLHSSYIPIRATIEV